MNYFKNIFIRKQKSTDDSTPLDIHQYVAKYIIATHIISMGEKVDVFTINGSPLLPYMSEALTNKTYENVIEHHIPIVMYNYLSVEDFPSTPLLGDLLFSLESALRENIHNPWVIRLVKSYEHNRLIKKDDLLKLSSSDQLKYEVSRKSYESTCGKWIKEFQMTCRNKNIRKNLIVWFNVKYHGLSEENNA